MAIYYAYMIRSDSIRKHYYGHTSDLNDRLHEHNSSQSPYTKGKGPWELVGYVKCASKSEAVQVEAKLKRMKRPAAALQWIRDNGVSNPSSHV